MMDFAVQTGRVISKESWSAVTTSPPFRCDFHTKDGGSYTEYDGLCTEYDGLCAITDGLCTIIDEFCTIIDGLCTDNVGLCTENVGFPILTRTEGSALDVTMDARTR